MTSEELQFEIHKLLDTADQEGLADDFLFHVMRLYGQARVMDGFIMSFCNEQTGPYVTEALRILNDWKMTADGLRAAGMDQLETLQ
jgi:hypothetical protein